MRGSCGALAGLAAIVLLVGTASGRSADGATHPRLVSTGSEAKVGKIATLGPKEFLNPVLGPGQDPSVVVYQRRYYFTQTSPSATDLTIRTSSSIKTLASAPMNVVWRGGEAGSPRDQWWAPELHHIQGRWYIYTTADDGSNAGHRLQVLEANVPLGPYTYKGTLRTPGNHWSIDPSPLVLPGGALYIFWSGWPGSTNGVQDIYVARMRNPWTIEGPRTQISTPTYPWERHSGTVPVKVNESPEPIVHNDTISVSYSASGCWTPDYSLGLLTARVGSDLLKASSWTKSPRPIFSSNNIAGIYGPASNGWFVSPNGKQTWIVFHATTDAQGNCGSGRMVFAQPVRWTADGTPDLGGKPLPMTTPILVPGGDPGYPRASSKSRSHH